MRAHLRQPSTWRTAPAAQGSSPRGALRHARAPVPDTPPAPYPWATQAKTDPGSIRSAANFVKTVDSVPLGFLKLVSLVERAVLPAPQPTALASWSGLARLLAALGTPGERLGRSAVSGSPWCCLQPVVLPPARGHVADAAALYTHPGSSTLSSQSSSRCSSPPSSTASDSAATARAVVLRAPSVLAIGSATVRYSLRLAVRGATPPALGCSPLSEALLAPHRAPPLCVRGTAASLVQTR